MYRCLPGHAVEPVGDGLSRYVRRFAEEDEKGRLKRILRVLVIEKAAANTPYHGGVPLHQNGKDNLVPVFQEAGQEFTIGHPASVWLADGPQVLDDHV